MSVVTLADNRVSLFHTIFLYGFLRAELHGNNTAS